MYNLSILKVFLIALFFTSFGILVGTRLFPVKEEVFVEVKDPDSKKIQVIPYCDQGSCPTYRATDMNGDGGTETVIMIPTANHGAGKIWIVKDGELVFDSGENPGIVFEEIEGGFRLRYTKDIYTGEEGHVDYEYENGEVKRKVEKPTS